MRVDGSGRPDSRPARNQELARAPRLGATLKEKSMSDPTAAIAASTLVAGFAPYLAAFVSIVVVPWAVVEFRRLTGAQVSQTAVDKLSTLAKAEAGAMMTASETNLAGVAIPLGSKLFADAANRIIASAPGVLASAGLTPNAVATMVSGHLGAMQASSPAAAAPAAVEV
jgi:hypothetical protein